MNLTHLSAGAIALFAATACTQPTAETSSASEDTIDVSTDELTATRPNRTILSADQIATFGDLFFTRASNISCFLGGQPSNGTIFAQANLRITGHAYDSAGQPFALEAPLELIVLPGPPQTCDAVDENLAASQYVAFRRSKCMNATCTPSSGWSYDIFFIRP